VSPLHNKAPHPIRVGFRIGWSRWARRLTSTLARWARVPDSELEWQKQCGPFFGNEIGELVLDGRSARFVLFATADSGAEELREVADLELSTS
jgi:hypothetical protein